MTKVLQGGIQAKTIRITNKQEARISWDLLDEKEIAYRDLSFYGESGKCGFVLRPAMGLGAEIIARYYDGTNPGKSPYVSLGRWLNRNGYETIPVGTYKAERKNELIVTQIKLRRKQMNLPRVRRALKRGNHVKIGSTVINSEKELRASYSTHASRQDACRSAKVLPDAKLIKPKVVKKEEKEKE